MSLSKRLTIFEGVDGSGKSTLAQAFAKATGARYVHCGPFPKVNSNLARLYVEAMLPAVDGYQDVVMDRCWLSEKPYGDAFREGRDRLGERTRLLERLAWRCETTVILCMPPWETVLAGFRTRKGEEYLEREEQLKAVFEAYIQLYPSLPMFTFNPLNQSTEANVQRVQAAVSDLASLAHRLDQDTAGNLKSKVLLVGDVYAQLHDNEPLRQWPFGSLHGGGCSLWLARELETGQISEKHLMWCNADRLSKHVAGYPMPVIALGATADRRLRELGVTPHEVVEHPQFWKRFRSSDAYPLIPVLKELIYG